MMNYNVNVSYLSDGQIMDMLHDVHIRVLELQCYFALYVYSDELEQEFKELCDLGSKLQIEGKRRGLDKKCKKSA